MKRASGAATSRTASSVSAWIMPATGVRAPDRMLVAVRAIAPVAGRPPNSGDTMFATPCAISSTFGLCRSPLMRSATTADISDSIAPSIAIVSAGDSSVRIRSGLELRDDADVRQAARDAAEPAADRLDRQPAGRNDAPCRPRSATMYPGTRCTKRFQHDERRAHSDASAVAAGETVPACRRAPPSRPRNSPGTARQLQAEEVADLRAGDERRRCRW